MRIVDVTYILREITPIGFIPWFYKSSLPSFVYICFDPITGFSLHSKRSVAYGQDVSRVKVWGTVLLSHTFRIDVNWKLYQSQHYIKKVCSILNGALTGKKKTFNSSKQLRFAFLPRHMKIQKL